MDLLARLAHLGKTVDKEFPLLNYGGCGVFAILVAKELKKRAAWPRIIIGGNGEDIDIEDIIPKIQNPLNPYEWWRHDVYFNHIGVEFLYKGVKYHYDSNGVLAAMSNSRMLGYKLYNGRMRIPIAEKLTSNQGFWNREFDREGIPRLKGIIELFLSND